MPQCYEKEIAPKAAVRVAFHQWLSFLFPKNIISPTTARRHLNAVLLTRKVLKDLCIDIPNNSIEETSQHLGPSLCTP